MSLSSEIREAIGGDGKSRHQTRCLYEQWAIKAEALELQINNYQRTLGDAIEREEKLQAEHDRWFATDKEAELAKELGYIHTRNSAVGSRFCKHNRNIWATQRGWQTADLSEGGYYTNSQLFENLTGALRRPLEKEQTR